MLHPWHDAPIFCFTSDIDWASDAVIAYSHERLDGNQLKLTYFNTHPSPFLNQLHQEKKINLLIHPNFLPDSSHGNSYEEVIHYCLKLVPDADGFRSHRYFEVNDILDEFAKRQFKFVSNHCTRCETHLKPLLHRSGLVSMPIFLEDGGYLLMDPELNFKALQPLLEAPGLKIINVHPAHMAFNTPHFAYTRQIKDSMSREDWNKIDSDKLQHIEYKGFGVRNTIQQMLELIAHKNYRILSMHEIYEEYHYEK